MHVVLPEGPSFDLFAFRRVHPVVKVKSTDSTDTLKPNPNGDKPLEPLDRAQKTMKNEYRKPQKPLRFKGVIL